MYCRHGVVSDKPPQKTQQLKDDLLANITLGTAPYVLHGLNLRSEVILVVSLFGYCPATLACSSFGLIQHTRHLSFRFCSKKSIDINFMILPGVVPLME